MRKYLAIILGVLLIMGLSATAYAVDGTPAIAAGDTEITLGGKITTRGWYLDNIDPYGNIYGLDPWLPRRTNSEAFYSSTFNLTMDVKVTDNVQGMVELETGAGAKSGLYYWGSYDSKPDDTGEIWFRQLWIQYTGSGLLGIPSGIKIGHMPLALGNKVFLDNTRFGDDAILVWIDPMKELHIAAGTAKLNEGDLYDHSDDLDGYILMGTYMIDKDNTVGLNWTWAHSDSNCPSLGGGHNVEQLDFHNFGLHGDGNIAGFTYAAEVDWQTGSVDGYPVPWSATPDDIDMKGWGAMAKIGYMIDPVNIRAMFAYGSGDDDLFDDECGEMQTMLGPDYGFTARKVHVARVYERAVRSSSILANLTTNPGGDITNTGIANTTVYNLGIDVTAMKDLTMTLDGYILQASETGAWEDYVGGSVDDDLGWEVDVTMNYKIAKNLNYFVEAGYFKAGDFYEDAHGIDSKGAILASHGISLEF